MCSRIKQDFMQHDHFIGIYMATTVIGLGQSIQGTLDRQGTKLSQLPWHVIWDTKHYTMDQGLQLKLYHIFFIGCISCANIVIDKF